MKTSPNYHQLEIIHAGMMQRKIGGDGIREKHQSKVDAPMQNVDYFDTYY